MTRTRCSSARRSPRGFTLVELMVAVTGGLFVAIAVFMLARDGSRFYQHESRVADATVGTMMGFGRLQADIARAGFLSSPNVRRDPSHCELQANPGGFAASWPPMLANLASVRIQAPSTTLPAVLAQNNRSPDAIVLAGSFSSSDEFPTAGFHLVAGSGVGVVLQTKVGPLPRLGYLNLAAGSGQQLPFLQQIFPTGRALRIVDPSGMTHYGAIAGVDVTLGPPRIILDGKASPLLRTQTPYRCALTGTDEGRVSVVNIVRYELRQVTAATDPAYSPLFADTSTTEMAAWEQGRTELVREELDARTDTGDVIPGTTEILAEYAVDLKFGLTVATIPAPGQEPSGLTGLPAGNANIPSFAGSTSAGALPQRIRAVRMRLSVRSAVPDRAGDIVGATSIPQGAFFRMNLGNNQFARVRTLQADVALPNHAGVQW